jgi:uncharacterized membrane protein YhiD involved in acid resistance
MAAGIGILAGLGAWIVLAIAIVLSLLLLVFGGPVEHWVKKHYPLRSSDTDTTP